jgi:hypothetical protein
MQYTLVHGNRIPVSQAQLLCVYAAGAAGCGFELRGLAWAAPYELASSQVYSTRHTRIDLVPQVEMPCTQLTNAAKVVYSHILQVFLWLPGGRNLTGHTRFSQVNPTVGSRRHCLTNTTRHTPNTRRCPAPGLKKQGS